MRFTLTRTRVSANVVALVASAFAVAAAPQAASAADACPSQVNSTTYYSIQQSASGKALDVLNFATTDNAAIWWWNSHNGANQQWRFVCLTDGAFAVLNRNSGKALEVRNGAGHGAALRQNTLTGGTNQHWFLTTSNQSPALRNAQSGLLIGASTTTNSAVQGGQNVALGIGSVGDATNACNYSTASTQQPMFLSTTAAAGVLGTPGAGNGGKATINGPAQRWRFVCLHDNVYAIINSDDGTALDVPNFSTTPGTQLQSWEFWGGTAQQFSITPFSRSTAEIRNVNSSLALNVAPNSAGGFNVVQNGNGSYWTFAPAY